MVYCKVALTTLLSVVVLFLMAKLVGPRQISQLSLFDYINGITIGSIGSELAMSGAEGDPLPPLIAVVLFGLATLAFSVVSDRSLKLRRFLVGYPRFLLHNGKMNRENFKKSKLNINEFLTLCRKQGWFDIAQIDTAILEENGSLSILPKSTDRPVSAKEAGVIPEQQKIALPVIADGIVLEENLKICGFDRTWLNRMTRGASPKDFFLATCDTQGHLALFPLDPNRG